jgi:transcriptional regulator with GAF, ATPase, and Fis domain
MERGTLEKILNFSHQVSNELVFDNLLKKLVRVFLEQTNTTCCAIFQDIAQELTLLVHNSENVKGSKYIFTSLNSQKDENSLKNLPLDLIQSVFNSGTSSLSNKNSLGKSEQNEKTEIVNYFCLPIQHNAETIGVLYLEVSDSKNIFTEEDINFTEGLLPQVGISIGNAIKQQEISQQAKVLEESIISKNILLDEQKKLIESAYKDIQQLADLGQEITSNLKIKPIVRAAHQAINKIMDGSIFTIGVYFEPDGTLDFPLTIENEEELDFHSYSLRENEHRLAVWCFRNAKGVFINNYEAEYNNYFPNEPVPVPKVGKLPNSVIYLPIFSKSETIGVMTVQTLHKNAYSEYHFNFLKNLATYISTALENAESYRNIEQSRAEINEQKQMVDQSYANVKLLAEIGQDIISNLYVDKIIEIVYGNVNSLMDAAVFSIGIHNDEKQQIEVRGSIENGKELPFHSYSLDNKDSLSILCFTQMKEIHISDCQAEFNNFLPNSPAPKAKLGEVPDSIIFLPLMGKDKNIGILTVQSFEKHAYTEYHMNILRNLAVYISIALENAEAYKNVEESQLEVSKKSELLKQSFHDIKLLGSIGQSITSSLSVERIIETVYESVNSLMDASVFWIGIYNRWQNSLDFKGGKEEGETIEDFAISIDRIDRLSNWCFTYQKEVLVNNIETDYRKYLSKRPAPLIGKHPSSIIYLPLTAKNNQLGVLSVQSFKPNAYTDYHLDLLQNLVTYVCIALENAQLYEDMEEKVEQRTAQIMMQKEEIQVQNEQINQSFENIKLLSQIGIDITGSLSTSDIINTAYENINKLMDANVFGIGILDAQKEKIMFKGALERGIELPSFHHDANDPMQFSVWALENKQPVFINDFSKEYKKYVPQMTPPKAGEDSESILYLPLRTQKADIGVLTVQSFKKSAYTNYHLDILKNLAVYIAIALENSEAYKEIEIFSEKLESTNQKFTSSINYAKRIQEAILPQMSTIRHHLPESFVLFKPRDIVSGDFYWFHTTREKIFIAAIDCTGHGVPGAFMSMIGNDILNEVVVNIGIEEPDYILSELHIGVRSALKQEQTSNQDGMDLAICVIDRVAQRIDFAGAKSPLVYVKDGEVHTVKPNRFSVGGYQHKAYRPFKKHSISTAGVDAFYLFSDGFQDQFGGVNDRKLRSNNFKKILLQIHKEPMKKQEELLEKAFNEWKGNTRQIDDVLVVGFRA